MKEKSIDWIHLWGASKPQNIIGGKKTNEISIINFMRTMECNKSNMWYRKKATHSY